MSLIKEFKSIPHNKILLLEVSKGKRNALLKKIAKYFHKERGEGELYRRVIRLIENFPIVVERVYGEFDKLNHAIREKVLGVMYVTTDFKEFFKSRFDLNKIIDDEYLDLTPEYKHEKWDGLYSLIGCVKLFKLLEEVDPTNNMKYGNWLVDVVLPYAITNNMFGRRIKKNSPSWNTSLLLEEEGTFFEDLPKLESYLKYYHEMKQKNELPDEYKDINNVIPYWSEDGETVKSTEDPFQALNYLTKEYRTVDSGDYFKVVNTKLKQGKDYKLPAKNADGYMIYLPITQKARSVLGMNSEWCTTYGEHCLNPDYQDRSPEDYENLIILVNKNNPEEKYQFHFSTGQFMNSDDELIKIVDFLLENQNVLKWILELQSEQINDWLHEKRADSALFIEKIVSNDKYNELFGTLISELEWVMPQMKNNNGVWLLEYDAESPQAITSSIEWMRKNFSRGVEKLTEKELLNKYLETREVNVAFINRGKFKKEIELSPNFTKRLIVHYNGIKDYNNLEIYK